MKYYKRLILLNNKFLCWNPLGSERDQKVDAPQIDKKGDLKKIKVEKEEKDMII